LEGKGDEKMDGHFSEYCKLKSSSRFFYLPFFILYPDRVISHAKIKKVLYILKQLEKILFLKTLRKERNLKKILFFKTYKKGRNFYFIILSIRENVIH